MRLQNKRKAKPIDKILSWAQALQMTCFGTPINVGVTTYKYRPNSKTFNVGISTEDNLVVYVFDSTMPREELFAEWGRCKNYVDLLLDKLVGRRVNAHGKEKADVQQ